MFNFKHGRFLTFHRQSLPSAIGSAHVFDVVSTIADTDRRVNIAQVLVIGEVNQIVRFSSDSRFTLIGDLDDSPVSGSFDDGEGEYSSNEAGLKLVASHFDNHILPTSICTL